MTLPTTTVEIAFDAGWTGTPTWTDVTDYVRQAAGISINHWRGQEDEQCPPSTLSLTLKNDDGRFTPGNTSGAYSPNVKKGRRIRVRSTVDATTYDRFNGYIDAWTVSWPAKVSTYSDCVITASSRMARLGRSNELRSIVEEVILLHDPEPYFTLGEAEGSSRANDTSGHNRPPLLMVGNGTDVVFSSATGPGTDGLTGATFAGGKYLRAVLGLDVQPSALPGIVAAFTVASAPASDTLLLSLMDRDLSVGPQFYISNDGKLNAKLDELALGPVTSVDSVADGSVHVLALTATSSPSDSFSLYLDGSLVGTEDGSFGDGTTLFVGGDGGAAPSGWAGLTGSVSHVAILASLDSTQIADITDAMLTGFADGTVAERLAIYATFAGIASADTDFDTGQVPDLAHIDTTGKTALAAMREVETTEGGVLFDALDGTLTFHDRAHRYGAVSAFTLDYDSGQVTDDLSPVLDDQQQANDVTATNSDGVVARVIDQDSIDDHGVYRESLDLATTDTLEPLSRANWTVTKYAEPVERISSVTVQLNGLSDALTKSILAAELGTKFTADNLPSNAPASSMDLFVEGRSDVITAVEDRITLRTSPADLFDVLILDDSTFGELDAYPLAY